ncbi:MAG: ABC transporter ATP-binding protein [Oscillospiraceae bacterium]|nr:ABC transporter ATP-binding protein [Oscillospiraceae bacterium]
MKKERIKKEPKKKPLYSMPSNIFFLMKKAWQMDKGLLLATVARMPLIVVLPLTATYLSKYVIELISIGVSAEKLISCILILSGCLLSLHLLDNIISTKIEWRSFGNRFKYIGLCTEKIMDMDYENYENPDVQTKLQKAFNAVGGDNGGTQQVFAQLVNIVSNIIGLVTYSALIFSLNPWLVLLLVGMTVANYYINKANNGWTYRNKDNWIPIDRKRGYVQRKAGNFEAAKDIRLYGMSDWFQNIFEILLKDRLVWNRKSEKRGFLIDFISAVMTFVRDGAAYIFLIYSVLNKNLSAADFVLYFGLISQYSGWLLGLIDSFNALEKTSLDFCDLREFLDLPDHFNRGIGSSLPKQSPEIIFNDVSFRYPKNENETLKHINIKINKGEKIALVGLNGAGKTTLVKLLCGLYRPTDGEIIVAGYDINEYNRDEYYTIMSVVFQDICLMPVSVAKNIALCEQKKIDYTRIEKVLTLSGLYEKVQSLPYKEDTLLLKSIHEEATDLSGGEKQKLALARALYKGGNVIVLDEPTAALDPIAENEMYKKYNELTTGATSVFISHRLSSTRFCDRILYLENGEITEEGTHDELMKLGGKYANMFNIQSHYYKEEIK